MSYVPGRPAVHWSIFGVPAKSSCHDKQQSKLGNTATSSPTLPNFFPSALFCSHLAVNSSKVSSACSPDRRRALVLKLPAASKLGTTRPARAASGVWRTMTVLARKKVDVEPRAATRRREEADIALGSGGGREERNNVFN